MGALVALARQVISSLPSVGRSVGRGITAPGTLVGGVGGTLAGGLGLPDFGFGGGGRPHRHRRRKMFTDTDLAQFAAAEAIGGKKTASALMMIRAAKA